MVVAVSGKKEEGLFYNNAIYISICEFQISLYNWNCILSNKLGKKGAIRYSWDIP